MGKMGVQLYSVHQQAGKDFLGTVEKLADLGYEGIQFFANFFGTEAKDLKRVIDDKGIVPAGSHISIEQLQGDALERTMEYQDTIGNRLLICPALPTEMRETADDYRRTADLFNEIGEKLNQNGFRFGYHNHAFEFENMDGQTGLDLLFENSDPNLVKVELDCFWAVFAGHDPIEVINKYKDRIVSFHLIDSKEKDGQKINTEIGNGNMDLKRIIQAGKEYGVEWFSVEQEDYEKEPFESLKTDATNLRKLLTEVGV